MLQRTKNSGVIWVLDEASCPNVSVSSLRFSSYSHGLMSPYLLNIIVRLSLRIPRTANYFFSEFVKVASSFCLIF